MPEQGSDRKRLILDAACRAIARHGAARVRVADVAREAGVSTALVHYYFPLREGLLERAFAHADEIADAVATAEFPLLASGRERLEHLLVAWSGDDPAIGANWAVWNEMWQYGAHHEGVRAMVADSHRTWLEQVTQLLAEGVEDGSLPASVEPRAAARRLCACVDDWGREVLLGLRTPGEMRQSVLEALAHEAASAEALARVPG
jgi:AcrR family transcriptional regulator